jgi:hypothetical protein
MGKLLEISAALAFALVPIGGANATEVLLTITGVPQPAAFELPQNPTPLSYEFPTDAHSGEFTVSATQIFPAGLGEGEGLTFYSEGINSDGGLSYFGGRLEYGDQLYGGPENSPTLILGAFVQECKTCGGGLATVTITAIPEPSTWAMMLAGLMGLGYAGCRGRNTVALPA